MKSEYKNTLLLPKTPFGIKANLSANEPKWLEKWENNQVYYKLREIREGKPVYTVHDGPPYANGHIHVGHAQGHVTKDIVVRCQSMLGLNAKYVPGWDCHGLPIEWKIEERYRSNGKSKDDVPVLEFRRECREFAQHWVDIQREEFKRMGVQGDWDNPYLTMSNENESAILNELYRCFDLGLVSRKLRPVLWSVVEQTALAEAEAEYKDKETQTVFVEFPIVEGPEFLKEARILIWTTTPWTLPANRGIAFSKSIEYSLVECTDEYHEQRGKKLVVATELIAEILGDDLASYTIVSNFSGSDLSNVICEHPLKSLGYEHEVALYPADFVTAEQGTGLVHLAPAYGIEDFELNRNDNLGMEVAEILNDNGTYEKHVPVFHGQHIFKVDNAIISCLEEQRTLFKVKLMTQSYPHSWRSKQPLIYRATPQWFIGMDRTQLRTVALDAVSKTRWIPENSMSRMAGMVQERPDWCISRQRTWGVPMAIFVNKGSGLVLNDRSVNQRILEAFRAHGADIWYEKTAEYFLGDAYEVSDYEQVFDVLDVWFESGCTHAFVLEARPDQQWPADLYLEGTDQHRGWFQSSLLEACATRGAAPYKTVVTHGFVNDDTGLKMSKSKGNVMSPIKIADEFGADVFRLWSATVDWKKDMRLGREVLVQTSETYRKIRNTFRFIAGNIDQASLEIDVPFEALPVLEQYVLERLNELNGEMVLAIEKYEYGTWVNSLIRFCDQELSRLYFDARKDTLYCDDKLSDRRKASEFVLVKLYYLLSRWFAPVLPFTMEELFACVETNDLERSIHLDQFPSIPNEWVGTKAIVAVNELSEFRRDFLSSLEIARMEKVVTKPSEATLIINGASSTISQLDVELLSDLCSVAEIELRPHVDDQSELSIEVVKSKKQVCNRCRVSQCTSGREEEICDRCNLVLSEYKLAIAS